MKIRRQKPSAERQAFFKSVTEHVAKVTKGISARKKKKA
jgi:hypothetical protein